MTNYVCRLAPSVPDEPSLYMQELTRYLSVNMNSVLLGLPTEIKELIYFDALSHAANAILAIPMDSAIRKISPAASNIFAGDVEYLTQFVNTLGNPILRENLDELVQTVALMQTSDPDEFFDVSQANKKYGRVNRANGAFLIEKVREGQLASEKGETGASTGGLAGVMSGNTGTAFAALGSRFGINRG
jgi:exocyst complex component 6